jgi:hypothetical protein
MITQIQIRPLVDEVENALNNYIENSLNADLRKGESFTVSVAADVEKMSDKLCELIQAKREAHKFNYNDSVSFAAACFERVLDLQLDDALSMAKEVIQ